MQLFWLIMFYIILRRFIFVKLINKTMKKVLRVLIVVLIFASIKAFALASTDPVPNSPKTYSIELIKKIADGFINNNLGIKNCAFADVDGDGNFDILVFNGGNVEYYRNTGDNDKPFFVPENMHYDKYSTAFFAGTSLPYPIFFADKNGDGKPDMFVIKDKIFNQELQQNEYKVMYAENVLGLDTGTLITIILVLVIVILVLAIIR